jgi:putative thioredoxin
MIDATESSFQHEVIDASRELPVLVDFWAPWCGPCRVLGPMLEKLEMQFSGRLKLVKVDSDRNPELAAQYRVRSIPYVVAFVDGAPVDSFVGLLQEPQLRSFADRLLPNPAELERRKAARLRTAGDRGGALSALRAALVLDAASDRARLDLADLLIDAPTPAADAVAEAAAVLAGTRAADQLEPSWRALNTRVQALQRAAAGPAVTELERRVAADASDLAARLELANALVARGEFAPALEHLLAIVERDRAFGDDIGRKTMLAVFDLAAAERDLVAHWRRRLAAALNR